MDRQRGSWQLPVSTGAVGASPLAPPDRLVYQGSRPQQRRSRLVRADAGYRFATWSIRCGAGESLQKCLHPRPTARILEQAGGWAQCGSPSLAAARARPFRQGIYRKGALLAPSSRACRRERAGPSAANLKGLDLVPDPAGVIRLRGVFGSSSADPNRASALGISGDGAQVAYDVKYGLSSVAVAPSTLPRGAAFRAGSSACVSCQSTHLGPSRSPFFNAGGEEQLQSVRPAMLSGTDARSPC